MHAGLGDGEAAEEVERAGLRPRGKRDLLEHRADGRPGPMAALRRAIDHDLEVGAFDLMAALSGDLEAPAGEGQRAQRSLELGEVDAQVDREGEEHVPGDAADGVEAENSLLWARRRILP